MDNATRRILGADHPQSDVAAASRRTTFIISSWAVPDVVDVVASPVLAEAVRDAATDMIETVRAGWPPFLCDSIVLLLFIYFLRRRAPPHAHYSRRCIMCVRAPQWLSD